MITALEDRCFFLCTTSFQNAFASIRRELVEQSEKKKQVDFWYQQFFSFASGIDLVKKKFSWIRSATSSRLPPPARR